jgi:hypothetical protein
LAFDGVVNVNVADACFHGFSEGGWSVDLNLSGCSEFFEVQHVIGNQFVCLNGGGDNMNRCRKKERFSNEKTQFGVGAWLDV